MREILRKKYIPMTETIYYTLLSVVTSRHGYAIMQHVSSLTKGRILLGTGTLYTMLGRLTSDGMIRVLPDSEKKIYQITDIGLELLREETRRLELQLEDGRKILSGGGVSGSGCGRRAGGDKMTSIFTHLVLFLQERDPMRERHRYRNETGSERYS